METKKLVDAIVGAAVKEYASDLFFFVEDNQYVLKQKVEDNLQLVDYFSLATGTELINFLKFHARMDITEHRRPQVGAYTLEFNPNSQIYLRLSSVGDFQGRESLVVRLLYSKERAQYFYPVDLDQLVELGKMRGLILTSGPTGSGKTTLMYELGRRAGTNKIVMCLEDPVEILEPEFFQTQINLTAGITYEVLLKAALRHRPDILIIGEIRDTATAKLAIEASLSGHLVLATVHAKSTRGTVMRLLDLGVSKNELDNAVTALTYQRLIRDKHGEYRCLYDIGYGNSLTEAIDQPRQGFFVWQQKVADLLQRGKIDARTAEQYQLG